MPSSQEQSTDAATVEALKTAQRLLRLHPSQAVAAALADAGLRSAHQVAALGEQQFVRAYAGLLEGLDGTMGGAELARAVHRQAANVVERVRLHAMNFVALADPVYAQMPAGLSAAGQLNFYSGLPGYQEMFGSLNYLQCEECRSVYSPAAYFVDLMRLIDGYVTRPQDERLALRARRPDLWEMPLDCEHTEQEVPYLQIVNRILEAQVRFRLEAVTSAQTGTPQEIAPLAFLSTYVYPFALPFNHPLARIRGLLEHFKVTLAEVYEAFRMGHASKDVSGSIAREVLQLAPEKYNLLITAETTTAGLEQVYGLTAAEGLNTLDSVDGFLQQTGLGHDQLESLLFQNLRRKRVMEFDGAMCVNVGHASSLGELAGDLTIEMWLRPTDFTQRRNPLNKNFNYEFAITQETAQYLNFYCGDASNYDSFPLTQDSQANLSANQWTHVAIVRDSNAETICSYINGTLIPAADYSLTTSSSTDDIWIGAGYVEPYIGQIADVRIWNIVRSQDEITADLHRRLSGNEPGLAGYWPLDDGVGTSVRDLTPYRNYGTAYAVPEAGSGSTSTLTEPPQWPLATGLVWDDNEINAGILGQFFINQGLNQNLPAGQLPTQFLTLQNKKSGSEISQSIVSYNSTNGTTAALNSETLDRLNRFIRLAAALDWSFADLDLALRSVKPPPATAIDEDAVKALAAIKKLQARLGLPTDELCALWSDVNTFGIGNGPTPQDLFDRTFNYPTSFADPTGAPGAPPYRPQYDLNPLYVETPLIWQPAARQDAQAQATRSHLRGALQLDDVSLSLLTEFLFPGASGDDTVKVSLDVPTLSLFYRHARLARALNLPLGQFILLLGLLKIEALGAGEKATDSINTVTEVVAWADWMRAVPLNVAQLAYLTTGRPNPWVNPGYNPEAVGPLLAGMFQGSQSLRLTPRSLFASARTEADAERLFQQLQEAGRIDANGVVLEQSVLGPRPLSRDILTFDGSTTRIALSQDPFIAPDGTAVQQFTVCAWVLPQTLATNAAVNVIAGLKDDDDNTRAKPSLYLLADSMTLGVGFGGTDSSGNSSQYSASAENFFTAADAWVHVAWTLDLSTSTATLYRNGALFQQFTDVALTGLYTSSTGYAIGALGSGLPWQGSIANVGVWRRVLVQDEIAAVMEASGVPEADADLAAYWLVDDKSATGGAIKDSVGTNDGTLGGTATWVAVLNRDTLLAARLAQDLYVTQCLAAFFNCSPELMAATQELVFLSHDQPLRQVNQLLIDLPPEAGVPDEVDELIAALALDLYLAGAFKLTPREVVGLARQPEAFGLTFGTDFSWSPEGLRAISDYQRLIALFGDTGDQLLAYFKLAADPQPAPTPQEKLASITGWPVEQITTLEGQDFWPEDSKFDTVKQVAALNQCFTLARTLGVDIEFMLSLRQLNTFQLGGPDAPPDMDVWGEYQAAAHALSQVIAAKYGNSITPQVLASIEGRLEEAKRDVLAAFLLWELSFGYDDLKTTDDLYDFLLIDVDMSSVVQISPLKAGLNSLQLYVQSTQMNLEAQVQSQIPRLWWSWMSRYRAWQANREIFLYPENYVNPALRRFKTPQFEQLENSLQQGNLTPALVESALTDYLQGLADVANLEVVASYRAQVPGPEGMAGASVDTLFIVARTRTNPPTYYHRTLRLYGGADAGQGVWTAWQQIDQNINAARVTPVYAFNKLFIFWVEQTTKTVSIPNTSPQQSYQVTTASIYYSFQKLDRSWAPQQTLEQNLPISVDGPALYIHATNPLTPIWQQVQALFDPQAQQIVIIYGAYVEYIPSPINVPATVGNVEIDAYNRMIYESQLFAQSIAGDEQLTSYVPLWTLGSALGRDRVNLRLKSAPANFCTGIMNRENQLVYAQFGAVASPALVEAMTWPKARHFIPLDGTLRDLVTGQELSGTPTWTTDSSCPFGAGRTVLQANDTYSEDIATIGQSLTLMVWFRLTSLPANSYTILQLLTDSGANGYDLWVYETFLYVGNVENSTGSSLGVSTSTSNWTCLAFTVDADSKTMALYTNGVRYNNASMSVNVEQVVKLSILGNAFYAANLLIWDRVLTNDEISSLYDFAKANHTLVLPSEPVTTETLLTTELSAAARAVPTSNQPGWFTFDNGDEAFLVTPVIPATDTTATDYDIFNSLQQMTTFTEVAPTESGRGVNRRALEILFGNAAVDASTFNFGDLKLNFTRLSTHGVSELQQRFLAGGVDALLSLSSQFVPELPFTRFTAGTQAIPPASRIIDFNGPYGTYFWELFFYVPFLIADTLGTNQKFQLAQHWLQYIFNPTRSLEPEAQFMEQEGLVGYWPLAGHAQDVSGSNDGIIQLRQEPVFVETVFPDGFARQVFNSPDDVDNSVQVDEAADLDITNAITLEGWCYLYDLGGDQSWIIIKKIDYDTDWDSPWYVYRLSINQGTFVFSVSVESQYVAVSSSSSQGAEINKWYYVAGTFDGVEASLYVNGEFIGKTAVSSVDSSIQTPAQIDTSSQNVYFGGDSFYGQLAEVRIWKTALTPGRIMAHYMARSPQARYWRFRPFRNRTLDTLRDDLSNQQQLVVYEYDPFDPDALARLRVSSYEKGIVMRYIENLIKWGDKLFAQYTRETISEATMLYTEALNLLGPKPEQVGDLPAPPVKTVQDFSQEYGGTAKIPEFLVQLENDIDYTPPAGGLQLSSKPFNLLNSYFCVPVNRLLLALWQAVDNQLYKIRHGENIKGQPQPLPLYGAPLNPAALARAGAGAGAAPSRPPAGSPNIPYYRFSYLLDRAKDLTSQVVQLGSSLLSALERQDAEQLALIQNSNEATILNLTTQIKQNQVVQLQQDAEALAAGLAAAQQRRQTYAAWLEGPTAGGGNANGSGSSNAAGSAGWTESLSTAEQASLVILSRAYVAHLAALEMRLLSSPVYLFPNIFGLADGGMEFGQSIEALAGVSDSLGVVLGLKSQLAGMVGQFQRRDQEWLLQYELADDDVTQIQAQLEANQTAQASAERDLQVHQEQLAQNQAIGSFYQSKFTSEQLYQWLTGRLSTLYFQSYQLAFALAQEAQTAFQYEQNSDKNYLNYGAWDSLEKGLTAGDSLMFSLNQLEKANLDAGVRHLEIEKTVSLLQVDPQAVLDLKRTGQCSFALTEQLFDYDFPGHYNRKLASVAITIPAIVGPYQNIHAALTQTANRVVLQPDIDAVIYLLPGGDKSSGTPPSIRSNWNVNQQVALSRGSSDTGLFELNFSDPRYLPFEGTGAISSWTLSLPQAANAIDFNSISDVIVQLNYTAQDGGSAFRQKVLQQPALQTFTGLKYLSLRQLFPEAWHRFRNPHATSPTLQFPLLRSMFPLNLEPETVMLGTPKSLANVPVGTISVQWLVAEGDTTDLPQLTLNKQSPIQQTLTSYLVELVVPGTTPSTPAAVPLSSFGPTVLNTLEAGGPLPEQVVDIALIIPFTGSLQWPPATS